METNTIMVKINLDNAAWLKDDGKLHAAAVRDALRNAAHLTADLIVDADLSGDGFRMHFTRTIRDYNGNLSGTIECRFSGEPSYS